MHYSRAHNAVYSRKRAPAVKHKGVYKRAAVIAGSGMHHHTLWFIYHKQVAVLINYIKRYIFGRYIVHGGLGHCYGNGVSRLYLIAFSGFSAVYRHTSVRYKRYGARARYIGNFGGKNVNSCGRIICADRFGYFIHRFFPRFSALIP